MPEDYRPINNLPVLEKVLELIIIDQLKEFLFENNVIANEQHGFRANHSTETALITLTDNVVQHLEESRVVITVFLDFKRAFETIDRKILIDKLRKYNFSEETCEWFRNFLSNRKQTVKLGDEFSEEVSVYIGVPQGSMIANMLFVLYINDIVKSLKGCDIIMYSDDTSISIASPDILKAAELMNSALEKISDWLKFNKILLNVKKSKYMIFGAKGKTDIKLIIDKTEIEKVYEFRYLGVIVD